MRSNPRRRRRKRNRSTPTQSNPNKKSKKPNAPDSSSSSDTENWSDIEVDIDDTLDESESCLASSVGTKSPMASSAATPAVSNTSTTVTVTLPPISDTAQTSSIAPSVPTSAGVPDNDSTTIATPGFGQSSQGADINQPCFISSQPSDICTPVMLQGQSQMMGFSSPVQHMPPMATPMTLPMPVPYAPALSENDIIRVALQVKNVLQDEIERMVTLKVQQATEHLNAEISVLKQSNSELKNELDDLKSKTDELEQYSRRSCVRISGVREAENENINEIVMGISRRIGANIAPSDIDRLHRVGRKVGRGEHQGARRTRDIIVKFTNYGARLAFLKGRKTLREQNASVFINEDLTSARMELAFECRNLKRAKIIKKVWTYNGNVFIEDNNDTRVKVVKMSDLAVYRVNNAGQT